MNRGVIASIFFFFILTMSVFTVFSQPAAAGFGYPATEKEGTDGFNTPPYESNGEILNDTQHSGDYLTLEKIPKITKYAGYGWASINDNYAYLTNGMKIYRMDLNAENPQPAVWYDVSTVKSGDGIDYIKAVKDGVYFRIYTYTGEGTGTAEYYYINYAKTTLTQIGYNGIIQKDTATNTVYTYSSNPERTTITINTYLNGIKQNTYKIPYAQPNDHMVLRNVEKRGDTVVLLYDHSLYTYSLTEKKIKTLANWYGSGETTAYYSDAVISNDGKTIYALLTGDYFHNNSVVEKYYNGILQGRYTVWKAWAIMWSENHNAVILAGKGIWVIYGDAFNSPAYYNEAVSGAKLSDSDIKPIIYDYKDAYMFDFRNYTASGTYTSPPVSTDGRIITGAYFKPVYEQPAGTQIYFNVSNDNGATWTPVNLSSGNISFINASDGDDTFMWRASLYGDEYHSPIIKSVDFILYTQDPVKITEVDLTGYLKTNRTAYYVGDPVDIIADIEDRDNERNGWTWLWDFGDPYANTSNPNTATTPFNATHIYTRPGTYTVNLTVSDIDGHNDTKSIDVIIADRPPIAKIWATSPYGGNDQFISISPGDTVMFNASNSTDPDMAYNPDEAITDYRWTTLGLSGKIINYTFNDAGTYSVILQVKDAYGQLHSTSIIVYVASGNHPPQPHISGPSEIMINSPTLFSSVGTIDPDGDTLTYYWDFGDGTNSTDPNPVKTYTEYGTYTINLTVSDGEFNISYYHVVKVRPYPAMGDWVIDSHIVVENWKIVIRGNIYIEPDGWLDLRNTSLYIDTPSDGFYTLEVKAGGTLTATNSDILTPYRKYGEDIKYRYHFYNFKVSGNATLDDTTVRNTWAEKTTGINGITITTDGRLEARKSTLIWSAGYGISRHNLLFVYQPPVIVEDSIIAMNMGGAAELYNADNTTIKGCDIRNMPGGISAIYSRNIDISDNTIKRIPGTAIYTRDSDIAITGNNLNSVGVGLYISGGSQNIRNNTIYGAGNNTIAIDLYSDIPIYDTVASYSSVGLYAHTTASIYDCQITRNADDFIVSGVVHVYYSVRVYVAYMNNPVSAYVYIKDGDSIISNLTTDNTGYSGWQYIEMDRIGTDGATRFNLTAEAHYRDMILQEVVSHEPHTEIRFNFAPVNVSGGVGTEEEAGFNWLYIIAGIIAIWLVLMLGWKFGVIRLAFKWLILIGAGLSLIWLWHSGVISIYTTVILTTITAIMLMWIFRYPSTRTRTYTTVGGLILIASILYAGGYMSMSLTDYYGTLGAVVVAIAGGLAYWLKGIGKGREYVYFPAVGLATLGTYSYLSDAMIYLYVGIFLTVMAVVGWYLIVRNASVSIGTAVIILAMLGIFGLILAYVLGVWYPGMFIEQITDAAKQQNPLNPDNWNIGDLNPFKGVKW